VDVDADVVDSDMATDEDEDSAGMDVGVAIAGETEGRPEAVAGPDDTTPADSAASVLLLRRGAKGASSLLLASSA
jgi:hypothetical protein